MHTVRQSCFEKRVLRQDGTGWIDLRDITLTRGGSDGPGAALTSRGEIMLRDCVIKDNLAEEPGGGVFSMRRVTVHRCTITGNLANDDGGGIYARRGGVQVYDSVVSTNLVDGSGGAIGSTGDILVVDSSIDGNTTDGDGGALYADEDADVTVIRSYVGGSDADGPGGAIFTLDGDVAVLDSTLIGNRADDRGGAISGEADVLVVNSTVARNLAVAHAGGGIWARGNLTLVNSTVTNNYAEGEGGGVLAAGRTALISSTLVGNISSIGADLGSSGTLTSFGSILGPPVWEGVTGDTIPTHRSCRVYATVSQGYNFLADQSCELTATTDLGGADPRLAQLEDDPHGFVLEPLTGSPVVDRIPVDSCHGTLPSPLPAGQLLASWIDWPTVLATDAIGRRRGLDGACDIGAVESNGGSGRRARPDVPALGPTAPPAVRRAAAQAAAGTPRAPAARASLPQLARRLARLDRLSRRFDVLMGCTTRVGVDRAGDARHRWGFLYDEGDGTGSDRRPALVLHRGRGRAQLDLLQLRVGRRCMSAPADPNGAGASARRRAPTLGHLRRLVTQVRARTERFDRWESCLSWLPVTEDGDREQGFGYAVQQHGRRTRGAAVDLDHSPWHDPDYQLLALKAGACGEDPGEAPDRSARSGVQGLREDVRDLVDPVDEITRFDQCLYTVGLASHGGYQFTDERGRRIDRPALSFDLRGAHLPARSVMAFPGEEPPQLECNEDAGGMQTGE